MLFNVYSQYRTFVFVRYLRCWRCPIETIEFHWIVKGVGVVDSRYEMWLIARVKLIRIIYRHLESLHFATFNPVHLQLIFLNSAIFLLHGFPWHSCGNRPNIRQWHEHENGGDMSTRITVQGQLRHRKLLRNWQLQGRRRSSRNISWVRHCSTLQSGLLWERKIVCGK